MSCPTIRSASFRAAVRNALLKRYFQARSLFGDLDFDAMSKTRPDALHKACNDLAMTIESRWRRRSARSLT